MSIKNNFLRLLTSSLLLAILFSSFTVKAYEQYPVATNYKYINDYVGIIDESQAKSIISIGKELEDKTSAQAVVVVIDSTNDIPIETYAINLFRDWGIGEKAKDNGLLILLAVEDRRWRIEVGRGLEGAIPDALSNRVMTSIGTPNFTEGNYGDGLLESYSTFCDYIAEEYGVTLNKSLNIALPNNDSTTSNNGSGLALGILAVLVFIDLIFNRGRISSTILQLILLSSMNRRGPRGGGGSGNGGFGGFGGGSSNGGGSSGGW